jgi:hypothetical protein
MFPGQLVLKVGCSCLLLRTLRSTLVSLEFGAVSIRFSEPFAIFACVWRCGERVWVSRDVKWCNPVFLKTLGLVCRGRCLFRMQVKDEATATLAWQNMYSQLTISSLLQLIHDSIAIT